MAITYIAIAIVDRLGWCLQNAWSLFPSMNIVGNLLSIGVLMMIFDMEWA